MQQLETERLILKRGTPEDYKKVYEYDFRKLRGITGEFKYEKLDPEIIKSFDNPSEDDYDYIVYLKDTMEPISNVVADRENKEINSIELAFNTHPNYWRHGYTTEALIEIMRFLYKKGYDNILCGYDTGNEKSKSLQEKLGFIPYKVKENVWEKNGVSIDTYTNILSKDRFYELYSEITNRR